MRNVTMGPILLLLVIVLQVVLCVRTYYNFKAAERASKAIQLNDSVEQRSWALHEVMDNEIELNRRFI